IHWFLVSASIVLFFFQAEDGIRDRNVTGVQTCALPICYPSGTADLVWFDGLDGEIIEPAGNIVLWIDNGKNSDADVEMFKNNYGITEDINIVKAPAGGGMANGAERDIVIAANTGEEIVSAGYNKPGDKNDVVKDMGIFYHYPIGSND